MNTLRVLGLVLLTVLLTACGFQLRGEARLPVGMQHVHIQGADPLSPLGRDLAKALARSGATIADRVEDGVSVLKITANALSTDVLSVGGNARATEYTIRYHVEFVLEDAAGRGLLPVQVIDLTRDFTFDASQALGVAAEQDLLTKELQREMVQAILRRLDVLGRAG
jgi:LPS-assembly lipoprotein